MEKNFKSSKLPLKSNEMYTVLWNAIFSKYISWFEAIDFKMMITCWFWVSRKTRWKRVNHWKKLHVQRKRKSATDAPLRRRRQDNSCAFATRVSPIAARSGSPVNLPVIRRFTKFFFRLVFVPFWVFFSRPFFPLENLNARSSFFWSFVGAELTRWTKSIFFY